MTIRMGTMLLLVASFGLLLMSAGAALIWWLIRDPQGFFDEALEAVGGPYVRREADLEELPRPRDRAA